LKTSTISDVSPDIVRDHDDSTQTGMEKGQLTDEEDWDKDEPWFSDQEGWDKDEGSSSGGDEERDEKDQVDERERD
jgi:hypothetical protein